MGCFSLVLVHRSRARSVGKCWRKKIESGVAILREETADLTLSHLRLAPQTLITYYVNILLQLPAAISMYTRLVAMVTYFCIY